MTATFESPATPVPLGPFQTNAYILRGPDNPEACWLIDPGMDPGPLIRRIREDRLRPERILLTHAHLDHIAGIPDVRAAFGDLPVGVHAAEERWLGDPELNLSAGFGLPVSIADPDELLEPGATLTLGGLDWTIAHTPGHSPGSVTFYNADTGTLIAGDTLFAGSVGRMDFPTSDGPALFESIKREIYTLPDETVVLPGHGPETTVGREKATNPYVRA